MPFRAVLDDGSFKLGARKQLQHLTENAGYSCHGGGGPPYGSRLSTQTVAEFYRRRSNSNLDRTDLHDNIVPWAEAQYSAKPKTLKWYRNEARVLCDYKPLADATLDAIKGSSPTGFKSARLKEGRAIATVNSTIRALRAVLNHAMQDGLIDVAPKFKILPGANVRSWILSPEQEPKYLNACTEPLRTVATIILDAGLRPDECFRLRWENVRWIDDKRAVLIVLGTKTEAASRIGVVAT